MKHKLHVEVELDDEFLKDVLITALEGGIGYWSACSEYKPDAGYAVIHELNDDETAYDGPPVVVNIETILLGIKRILERPMVGKPHHEWISNGVRNNDAGDIDSECADLIVQAALFDEVRYG